MFSPALVCVSVCLSVTTITKKIVDGFAPNFMRRFLWRKGRPSLCFVTIGRGTVKKLHKAAIVYKIAPLENSKLAGRKIVSMASVVKCWRQKRFRGDLVLSQSTFHLVSNCAHLSTINTLHLHMYRVHVPTVYL